MNAYDLPPRRYSYDEIAAYPDEARRELHDGTPSLLYAPGHSRSLAYAHAIGRLSMWLGEANLGGKLGQTFYLVDWQLDEWNSLVVDLCFFRRERLEREKIKRADNQCLIAAPDLVNHVIDSLSQASVTTWKFMRCIQRDVPFFWEVDLTKREFWAFQTTMVSSTARQGFTGHRVPLLVIFRTNFSPAPNGP